MAMKRFRVEEHSMTPTLMPGDEVVVSDTLRAVPGDLVVFEHPDRDGFWLIKRLVDDSGWVSSDDPEVTRADSRTLGPIPVETMLPVVHTIDSVTFAEATALLAEEDDAIASIVELWGIPEFWHRPPGFKTLVLLILEQQVSLESGAAMFRRLSELTTELDATSILAAGETLLRSVGVTRQKTAYLLDLATRVADGRLDLAALTSEPTSLARAALIEVKGVGAWTADAYLLSALRRPDVWPVGDRALQVGAAETLGMATAPDESQLELIGESWRPIRAVAARLIWHAYLCRRGRTEPADPPLSHGTGADA